MRYLCVYKPGTQTKNAAPSQREMQEMGKLIEDMSRAGVLLATGGCQPSAKSVRLDLNSARVDVQDGPFDPAHHIGGYCLMQVKSKAEAIEWGKRFLTIVQHGSSELLELEEFTPPAA